MIGRDLLPRKLPKPASGSLLFMGVPPRYIKKGSNGHSNPNTAFYMKNGNVPALGLENGDNMPQGHQIVTFTIS